MNTQHEEEAVYEWVLFTKADWRNDYFRPQGEEAQKDSLKDVYKRRNELKSWRGHIFLFHFSAVIFLTHETSVPSTRKQLCSHGTYSVRDWNSLISLSAFIEQKGSSLMQCSYDYRTKIKHSLHVLADGFSVFSKLIDE